MASFTSIQEPKKQKNGIGPGKHVEPESTVEDRILSMEISSDEDANDKSYPPGTFTKKKRDVRLEPFAREFDHLKRWPLKINEQQSVGGQHPVQEPKKQQIATGPGKQMKLKSQSAVPERTLSMGISSYASANHESYPRGTFTMEKQDVRLEPFAPEFNHLHRWSLNINKQQSVGGQHSEAKAGGTVTKKPRDAVLEPFAPEFDHLKRWPLKIDEQHSAGGQHQHSVQEPQQQQIATGAGNREMKSKFTAGCYSKDEAAKAKITGNRK